MLNIALKTRPVRFGHYVTRLQFTFDFGRGDMESRILDKHSNLQMKIVLSVKFSSWISYSCLIVSYGNIRRSIVSLWRLALKEWVVRRADSRSAIKTLVTHLNTHVPQIQGGESGELCYRFLPFLSVCTNKHHLKSPVTFMFLCFSCYIL